MYVDHLMTNVAWRAASGAWLTAPLFDAVLSKLCARKPGAGYSIGHGMGSTWVMLKLN